MATAGSITIDTRQVLVNSSKLSAYVDIHNETPGFNWDDRTWPTIDEEKSTAYFPVLWDQSRGGIHYESFQSGIGHGDDLEYKGMKLHRNSNSYEWNPLINHGHYYRHYNERYLYSSESVNDRVTEEEDINGKTVDVYNYALPLKDFIQSSANIYKRNDAEGIPIIDTNIRQRTRFSGTIVDGEPLETVDGNGDIIWANVDLFKDEFVVDRTNQKFIFNKTYIERIGISPATTNEEVLSCELLGEHIQNQDMILTTEHFPIVPDSAKLYAYDKINDTFFEVPLVADLSTPSATMPAAIDYDTGLISFGETWIFTDLSVKQSDLGVAIMFYITYEKTPRIEYEPAFSSDLKEADININPLKLGTNRGFLFLSERDNFLYKIVVTVDKPLMGNSIYGPMYTGGDYAVISAKAYNLSGQPLSDAEITFDIEAGDFGYLNGQQGPVTSFTDFKGHAYATMNTSSTLESVSAITSTLSVDNKELILDDAVEGWTTLEDVYLFQLRTDDLVLQDGDNRKVIVYTYDNDAIDPNKYQDWLEAGSPRDAVDDTEHPYYFKTGGNVPLRPISIDGNRVTYDVELDPVAGDVAGYLVTTGKIVKVNVSGFNELHRSTVRGNSVSLKIQLPTYVTGAFVDYMNNYVYYGFRFADEHAFAASSIGTATFLTINPVESSGLRSQFDINI